MDALLELILVQTGRLVLWALSWGQLLGDALTGNESRIHSAAGALTYVVDDRRKVTIAGMQLTGFVFYLLLCVSLFLIFA